MKKLLTLFLALALVCPLMGPTLAAHRPEQERNFDADAFFSQPIGNPSLGIAKGFRMALNDVPEELFRPRGFAIYLNGFHEDAPAQARVADLSEGTGLPLWRLARYADGGTFSDYLNEYGLTEVEYACMENWVGRYIDVHPEEYTSFDADAWFEENLCHPPGDPNGKANWFAAQLPGYQEADFQKEMCYLWLTELYARYERTQKSEDVSARYPSEYASFDADAWFAGYYVGVLGVAKAQYMETEHLAEEDFRAAMFAEWAGGAHSRFNGLAVTVNGTPIQFQAVRTASGETAEPVARDGRILAPLRTVAEAMDFTVAYDGAAQTVSCVKGGVTVTFTLDSAAYSIVSPGGTATLNLDVPSVAEDGRIYVPLRALGEALGYAVAWNAPFQTAALTAG
jgi:hypothetical protein